jgi:hypothetical protein
VTTIFLKGIIGTNKRKNDSMKKQAIARKKNKK